MRKTAIFLAALTAFAAPVQAAVVLSDGFDGENGGASLLNYDSFANFGVIGQVDLVASGDFGITCAGSCVDLDGSTGPGTLVSGIFNYNAGDKITLSFDLGGSQRVTGGSDVFNLLIASTDGVLGDSFSVLSEAGFSNYVYSFTSLLGGQLQFTLGTTSADNVGPLLDNVILDISPVPEPATWAMMIGGFALVGASLRRRKAAVSFA